MRNTIKARILLPATLAMLLIAPAALALVNPGAVDINSIKPDLVVPAMTEQAPAAGLRVKQATSGYENTKVHHALYLPTDWKKGKKYPVIVEYAGNRWRTSPGTVQGSKLGYGTSGGKGFIWICMPCLNNNSTANVGWWWGDNGKHDPQLTVDYCIKTVREVCKKYGGDSNAVILCGFSRGSVACNYIGLFNDEIAKLWRAFVCYSHYDGVDERRYLPESKRHLALERLKRLKGRPQFICCEAPSRRRDTLQAARDYIESTGIKAPFTYMYTGFLQHDDAWTLRPCAARKALRAWMKDVLDGYNENERPTRRSHVAGAAKPEPSEKPAAPSEADTERFDAMLRARLAAALAAGKSIVYRASRMRAKWRVVSIDDDGKLAVRGVRMPVTMKIAWSTLPYADRASLALAVLRRGNRDDHAMAGFYLPAAGRRADAAEHLRIAGDGR